MNAQLVGAGRRNDADAPAGFEFDFNLAVRCFKCLLDSGCQRGILDPLYNFGILAYLEIKRNCIFLCQQEEMQQSGQSQQHENQVQDVYEHKVLLSGKVRNETQEMGKHKRNCPA